MESFFVRNARAFVGVFFVVLLSGCLQSTDEGHRHQITFDRDTLPVVVLGGGVAGLTAAIYLAQANIPVTIIEGPKPGGALSQSQGVRNWPGQYNVPGADIVQKIKEHALACGVQIVQARITAASLLQNPFIFDLESMSDGKKSTVKAASCIIAVGTEPNLLEVPGEQGEGGYWGRGVSNCAVCDGFFFKGKQVMVVGGGDSAVEEASYLANLASTVTLVIRKDTFRAKDVKARDRLVARPNVKVMFDSSIKEIIGDGKKVTGVRVNNSKTGEQQTVATDGVFLAIGSRPNTDLFKGQLDFDSRGFIVLKNHQATSVAGVFAAGDVSDPLFVQAITAAGDGCRAALQAKKYLEEVGYKMQAGALEKGDESARVWQKDVPRGVVEIESEQQFKDVVANAQTPVFLDMYASWCFPCKRMMPIVEKLAKAFEGKVIFAKVNVANKAMDIERLNPMIHGRAVYSVPTFILIKDGKEVKRIEGSRDYEVLKKAIETSFGDSKNLAFVR